MQLKKRRHFSQGNVPISMPEIFPHANTTAGWVDALDPLFDTIAKVRLTSTCSLATHLLIQI